VIYRKRVHEVTPELAEVRFNAAVTAASTHADHWPSLVPGWRSPALMSADAGRLELCYEKVDGCPLGWPDLAELLAALVEASIALQPARAGHSQEHAIDGREELPSRFRAPVTCWLASARPRRTTINGDLHPGNVLRATDDFCLIDWELSRKGWLGEEIAGLTVHALRAAGRGHVCPSAAEHIVYGAAPVVPAPALWALTRAEACRQAQRELLAGSQWRADERMAIASVAEDRLGRLVP